MKFLQYLCLCTIIFQVTFLAHASPAPHLLISEIQISGASGFSTDEFVELYNPTDAVITITGWQLLKRTATGTVFPLVEQFEAATVPAHGYFLIAHPTGYTGSVVPDARYSTANSLSSDNSVELVNPLGIVDLVGWGTATHMETAPAPTPGIAKSIERKALSTSTKETMRVDGADSFRGNGEDTQNNSLDFLGRDVPQPQSTTNELEFVTAPAPVVPSAPPPSSSNQNTNTAPPPAAPIVAAPITVPTHEVLISELLPDPKGIDLPGEWIEIYNRSTSVVPLAGWILADASKTTYTFPTKELKPGSWLVVPRTDSGIALNNTGGETVTLTAPDGMVTSTVKWTGVALEAQAYALVGEAWMWTGKATPGAANVFADTNQAPRVAIREVEAEVWVGTEVKFTADVSDPDGDDVESSWQFSDGGKATGAKVTHVFPKSGIFSVTVTAKDTKGKVATAKVQVKVRDYQRSADIRIVRLLPNPTDGEEWVEIENTGTKAVDLTGWVLRSSTRQLKLQLLVAPKAVLKLTADDLPFALRNDGGTLELVDPDAKVVSVATYPKAKPGEVLTRNADGAFALEAAATSPLNTGINANQAATPRVAGESTNGNVNGKPVNLSGASPKGGVPSWVWAVIAGVGGAAWLGYELVRLYQRRKKSKTQVG
ncbi:MAG: lamin tail domain-containing protein [Patescibacteria group bacterium]|jgi:hypothetical protein